MAFLALFVAVILVIWFIEFAYFPTSYKHGDWWEPFDRHLRKFDFANYVLPEKYEMITYRSGDNGDKYFLLYKDKVTGQLLTLVIFREHPKIVFNEVKFQSDEVSKIRRIIRPLECLLDEVSYLGLCPAILTQQAKKSLWVWAVEYLKSKSKEFGKQDKKPKPKKQPTDHPQEQKIRGHGQEIIQYLKQFPNARVKDIAAHFRTIPPRTIKRGLQKLIKSGFIHREVSGKVVRYTP